MTLNGQNAYAVTGNEKEMCYKRDIQLVLVSLTCLLSMHMLFVGC